MAPDLFYLKFCHVPKLQFDH